MELPRLPSELKRDSLRPWRQLMTARAIAEMTSHYDTQVIKRLWGDNPRQVEEIQKAAVSPASTDGWGGGLSATSVGTFLRSLRTRSAAAQLFASPVPLTGRKTITLPAMASDWPAPAFVAEGGPLPVYSGTMGSVTLGPPKKMAMVTAVTGELARYAAEDAVQILSDVIDDATARSLDAALFSTAAASDVRPAGLLNGVTPITAYAGSGLEALVADIQALVGAINAAGGGSSIVIFANPVQAVALSAYANAIGYPVIPAPSLAAGTVIAVEAGAFASGFDGMPQIETSKDATIHFDDAATAISTTGTPNTIAAPVRSAYQSDLVALRMILPCAWAMRGTGLVQFITGANW